MKTNKFFTALLSVLALVGFTACDGPTPEQLKLSETSVTLKVGQTKQITANIAVESWTSSDDTKATVKDGLITAIAEGNATITATANGETKTCAVLVTKDGEDPNPGTSPYDDFEQLQGKEYYTFFLDESASAYLGDKVIYYFGPNDHEVDGVKQGSRWLYLWDETFVPGTGTGADPFDQANGWTSLVQNPGTWAGAGLCVAINDANNVSQENTAEDLAALNDIQKHITNYDEWYFAVGLKNATQGAAYDFKLIGSNVGGVESGVGNVNVKPAAIGEWVYLEYKLSDIAGLEFGEFTTNGSNILTIVANPYMAGTQLDLGYVFLYKK